MTPFLQVLCLDVTTFIVKPGHIVSASDHVYIITHTRRLFYKPLLRTFFLLLSSIITASLGLSDANNYHHTRYTFDEGRASVELNTTAHEVWWPRVLAATGSPAWRMPFSNRVSCIPTHKVTDNCTWMFRNADGKPFPISMFEKPSSPNATTATLNPEFERLFTILFTAVSTYLERMGWADQGNWVQVTDEPVLGRGRDRAQYDCSH